MCYYSVITWVHYFRLLWEAMISPVSESGGGTHENLHQLVADLHSKITSLETLLSELKRELHILKERYNNLERETKALKWEYNDT